MKRLYRRFLELSAILSLSSEELKQRVREGTLGFGDYIYLVVYGIMFFFSWFMVVVIYSLTVRPYKWAKKNIFDGRTSA